MEHENLRGRFDLFVQDVWGGGDILPPVSATSLS